MSKPVRVGIIGCGVIGPTHVESYQRLQGVEVVWACDVVEEKARAMAAKYGIPRVAKDYAELLNDTSLDAVSICTDHASHAPIAVDSLGAGKHVLCEKALAASAQGLDAMLAAHRLRPDLVFGGVFQHRFDPNLQCVKNMVERGVFGTLLTGTVQVHCLRTKDYYRADRWRGTWSSEGGAVVINQAIHFVDALVWIMGGVSALAGAYENRTHGDVIETEDTATAALRFRCGALGTLEATSSSNLKWEHTISVHGDRGGIDIRSGEILKIVLDDPARQREVEAELAACREDRVIDASAGHYGYGHPAQIADFVDAIRDRRLPFVTAESARHTVDVVLALYESCRSRAWVDLPAPVEAPQPQSVG